MEARRVPLRAILRHRFWLGFFLSFFLMILFWGLLAYALSVR